MKQLMCPLAYLHGHKPGVCLEENCAFWVAKGDMSVKQTENKQMKVYEKVGCCAVRAIARAIK